MSKKLLMNNVKAETIYTYNITYNLSKVILTNAVATIKSNETYTASITVLDDYELSSVVITVGEVDVTDTAYNSADNTITIDKPTGDIVITIIAEEVVITPTEFEIIVAKACGLSGITECSGDLSLYDGYYKTILTEGYSRTEGFCQYLISNGYSYDNGYKIFATAGSMKEIYLHQKVRLDVVNKLITEEYFVAEYIYNNMDSTCKAIADKYYNPNDLSDDYIYSIPGNSSKTGFLMTTTDSTKLDKYTGHGLRYYYNSKYYFTITQVQKSRLDAWFYSIQSNSSDDFTKAEYLTAFLEITYNSYTMGSATINPTTVNGTQYYLLSYSGVASDLSSFIKNNWSVEGIISIKDVGYYTGVPRVPTIDNINNILTQVRIGIITKNECLNLTK